MPCCSSCASCCARWSAWRRASTSAPALLRSLERLEEGFDFRAGPTLGELASKLAAFRLGSLESPLFGSSGQRAVLGGLADLLLQIAEVSGRVSDQLALRFFVHVDASQRTQSS